MGGHGLKHSLAQLVEADAPMHVAAHTNPFADTIDVSFPFVPNQFSPPGVMFHSKKELGGGTFGIFSQDFDLY